MPVNPNYIFHPKPLANNFLNHLEYAYYFSDPECDSIIEMAQAYEEMQAGITTDNTEDLLYRKSRVRWIECLHDNEWLWLKMATLAELANDNFYHYDLIGFKECFQYTEYEAPGEHYTWHMDYGNGYMSQRKLSICVQLSNPDDYEGGELHMFYKHDVEVAQKTRGTAIVFPSFTMHKVTPVTSGLRKSLVSWVSGGRTYR